MVTTQTTLQQLNGVTEAMTAMIEDLSAERFNIVPFEGSWTAGQLLQHIIKSDNSMLGALRGSTVPTTIRRGDELIEGLKDVFLNFGQKFDAPDFIVPEAQDYDKETLLATFKHGREEMVHVLQHTDVTETCGHFILQDHTRLELLWFVIVHTARHNHQLEKIIARLNEM